MSAMSTPLVSAEWLKARLGADNLVVIDASWYLPAMNRNGAAEYAHGHIPGAYFFDIDAVADHATSLPHMLPSADAFAQAVGAMGCDDAADIVVYDGAGLFSAPRLWWMFQAFGHNSVAVLDGGLPGWIKKGGVLETAVPARRTSHFSSRAHPLMVAALDDVRDALERRTAQVFDARPAARFHGKAPEPRPGLKSGHMPGSLSLPASDLIENGFLKEPADILAAFESAGADWRTPVITSCGSGVSAAILTLGLVRAGREPGRLYDGSWSEWGARKDLPVARETRDG